jgi:hypothetical protein
MANILVLFPFLPTRIPNDHHFANWNPERRVKQKSVPVKQKSVPVKSQTVGEKFQTVGEKFQTVGEKSQAVGKKSHGLGFRWDNVAAAVFLKMLLQLFF